MIQSPIKTKGIVKISPRNRVTIPKEIRQTLGVKAGDEILFIPREGIVYVVTKEKRMIVNG